MLSNYNSIISKVFLIGIIVVGIILRLVLFSEPGGDYPTYKLAVEKFYNGENPYVLTVESFTNPNIEHGYAYFPTLLYIMYFIWWISNFSGIIVSSIILWKIPTFVAELTLLYYFLKKIEGKPGIMHIAIAFFWLLNPYFVARYDYGLFDPLFLVFTFLAIKYIDKGPKLSGLFYAIAVSLKTIPAILLPLFLVKLYKKNERGVNKFKDIIIFGFIGLAYFLVMSAPFMKSLDDFLIYLNGSLFVHSSREVQGRPFLTFVSYFLGGIGVNFYQHFYTSIYSLMALLAATFMPIYFYFRKYINSKYAWALCSFAIYLLLTPVLSRTHILWLFPWLIVVLINKYNTTKHAIKLVMLLSVLWIGMFMYTYNWAKGFENYVDQNNRPILETAKKEWDFIRIGRHKYYEYRGILLEYIN